MYKVKTENGKEQQIKLNGNEFSIDGKKGTWDLIKVGDGMFHIIKDNRSFNAEVIAANHQQKTFSIKVNGTVYNVQLKDRFDDLLHELGMDATTSTKVNNIKAPMPGLVLKILVEAGQEIDVGDTVIILEAMKMENSIKSSGNGKVKSIKVKERDAVEKNQILLELD